MRKLSKPEKKTAMVLKTKTAEELRKEAILRKIELHKRQSQAKPVQEERKPMLKPKPMPKKVVKVVSKAEYAQHLISKLPKVSDDPMRLKILLVKDDVANAGWNKHLPIPLQLKEKVIVREDRKDGSIRVCHGPKDKRVESYFEIDNFTKLDGSRIYWKPMKDYIRTINYEQGVLKIDPDNARFKTEYVMKRIKVSADSGKRR